MTFAHPLYLFVGIVLVAAFAWFFVRSERRGEAQALAYSHIEFFLEATRAPRWVPLALRGLSIFAVALVALAAAGPRAAVPVPARDGSVVICIDTSGSMQSTDVAPTREEAAKRAAQAFIEETPPGVKIGIIAFSTQAALVAPLTADHAGAISSLNDVPYPDGGTAIGDALRAAAAQLGLRGHRAIVLITDGVSNSGSDPDAAASEAGRRGIPIYTIGIGTPNGDVIPGTNEQASIDEEALRSYARSSGGAYARAENASQLHDALARLGRITSLEYRAVDIALPIAIGGATLLAAAFLTGLALGRYP